LSEERPAQQAADRFDRPDGDFSLQYSLQSKAFWSGCKRIAAMFPRRKKITQRRITVAKSCTKLANDVVAAGRGQTENEPAPAAPVPAARLP